MSLSRRIADAVESMSHVSPEGPGWPCAVEAVDDGRRLSLSLTAATPVGLAFNALDYADDDADQTPDALRAWGDRLASRLTYLMEPLAVVEHERAAGELVLRSRTPTSRGGATSFYEVKLHRAGTLRLSRLVFDAADRRRRPTPCRMTVEALERLADDLAASAG